MWTRWHVRNPGVSVAAVFAGLAMTFTFANSLLAAGEEEGYGATYARVRYIEGRVTVVSAGEGREADATTNMPLAPSDRIQTQDGRVEIELADGSVLWLDDNTRLDLRTLADINNRYEKSNLLALTGGAIRLEGAEPDSKDKVFRVDTPHGSVYLLSGGSFRVDTESDETAVSSFRGVAELSGDDGSVLVRSGEMSRVDRDGTPIEPRSFNTLRTDDFDRFCETRQAAFIHRDGAQQEAGEAPAPDDLPSEVQPYASELSYYGGWYNVPSYGWVWRPTYYGGWSPYLNGYWGWYPTGWSWVSYDAWGWAPYHYGRWDVAVGIGWVWIPGHAWSGAWVSFAVGPAYIGWCPLNYYNYPVYHHADFYRATSVNSANLHGRGWHFVPSDRFSDRRGGRSVVPVDRLPHDSDFVITGRLPRFEPKEFTGRPERGRQLMETVRQGRVPLPAVAGEGGKPAPFKNIEGVGRMGPRHQPAARTPAGGPNRNTPGRTATAPRQGTGGRLQPDGRLRDPRSGRPNAAPPPSQPDSRRPSQGDSKSQPREGGSEARGEQNQTRSDLGSQRSEDPHERSQRIGLNPSPGTGIRPLPNGRVTAGGRVQTNNAGRPMRIKPGQYDLRTPQQMGGAGSVPRQSSRLRPMVAAPESRQPARVVGRFFQGVRREASPQQATPGYSRPPSAGTPRAAQPRPAPAPPQGQTGRSRPNRH